MDNYFIIHSNRGNREYQEELWLGGLEVVLQPSQAEAVVFD